MAEQTDHVRVAFLNRLDPKKVDGYRELHKNVPEFVTDTMEEAGVSDFRLFVRDEIAVCVFDVEDPDRYAEVMSAEERMDEWERKANEYKLEGVDVDSGDELGFPWMEEIWRFTPGDE